MADELWNSCQFDLAVPTVVINSNSATEQARLWPAAKVQELATTLANEHSYQVLLHCGPAERELANRLAAEVNHPAVASMGRARNLPIGLTKAVLARACAVVSTDSGPRHVAVALNRPVISLFGPTDPLGTRTYNLTETILAADLPCRPCYAKSCPLKHGQCMQSLEVSSVIHAIQNVMNPAVTRAA
jgi:heptosyltransferase-2